MLSTKYSCWMERNGVCQLFLTWIFISMIIQPEGHGIQITSIVPLLISFIFFLFLYIRPHAPEKRGYPVFFPCLTRGSHNIRSDHHHYLLASCSITMAAFPSSLDRPTSPTAVCGLPHPSPPAPVPIADASTDRNYFNSSVPTASAVPLSSCRTAGSESDNWSKTGFLSFTPASARKTTTPTACTPRETDFGASILSSLSPGASSSASPLSRSEAQRELLNPGRPIRGRATISHSQRPITKPVSPALSSLDRCTSTSASFSYPTSTPTRQFDCHRLPIRSHDTASMRQPSLSSSSASAVAYSEAASITGEHRSRHSLFRSPNPLPQFADQPTLTRPVTSPGRKGKTRIVPGPSSGGQRVLRRKGSFQGRLSSDWSKESTDGSTMPTHSRHPQAMPPESKSPPIRSALPRDGTTPSIFGASANHKKEKERSTAHMRRKTTGTTTGLGKEFVEAGPDLVNLKEQVAFLKKQRDFYHAECEFLRELAHQSGVVIPERDKSRVDMVKGKTREQRQDKTKTEENNQADFNK